MTVLTPKVVQSIEWNNYVNKLYHINSSVNIDYYCYYL